MDFLRRCLPSLRAVGGTFIALSMLGCLMRGLDSAQGPPDETPRHLTEDLWRAAWFLAGVVLLGFGAVRDAISSQTDSRAAPGGTAARSPATRSAVDTRRTGT